MSTVNEDNWPFCHYAAGPLAASLTLGGDGEGTPRTYFLVKVTKEETQEVFQREFCTQEEAVAFMNERYGHWDFVDTTAPVETGGCSSCANST